MSSIAPKKRPVGVRFLHKIACYFLDLCVVLLGVSYGNNSPFRRLMCVRLKLIFTILCNQVERYFPCTIVMLKRKKVFISWHCPHCIILLLNIIYSIAHCCAPCNISSGHQKDVFGNIRKKTFQKKLLVMYHRRLPRKAKQKKLLVMYHSRLPRKVKQIRWNLLTDR